MKPETQAAIDALRNSVSKAITSANTRFTALVNQQKELEAQVAVGADETAIADSINTMTKEVDAFTAAITG